MDRKDKIQSIIERRQREAEQQRQDAQRGIAAEQEKHQREIKLQTTWRSTENDMRAWVNALVAQNFAGHGMNVLITQDGGNRQAHGSAKIYEASRPSHALAIAMDHDGRFSYALTIGNAWQGWKPFERGFNQETFTDLLLDIL